MKGNLKVSVIMPIYNVEKYLRFALDSLVNQSLKEFEIILIDDGSTDNSSKIIEEYKNKYENIIAVYQENSGPSKARNKGIGLAKGEFIVFMDSDDILPEDSLEARYNLAKEKKSDIVVCATVRFDQEKEWPMKTHFLEEGYKDIKSNYDLLWTLGPCNKLFKSELIKEITFPEEIKYAEDQVFVMKAYLSANKIYATKYVAYKYRMRDEKTESLTQQIYTNSANVLEQVYKSWNATLDEINDKVKDKNIERKLKGAYFRRLINIDIWPPFSRAISSKQKEIQLKALKNMKNIIDTLDKEQITDMGIIKRSVVKVINDNKLIKKDDNKVILIYLLNCIPNAINSVKRLIKGIGVKILYK